MSICTDSTVMAWGYNVYGELGNGNNSTTNSPVAVNTLTGIKAVSIGTHSLALKNDGTVWAWGYNNVGQLGIGNNTDSNIPVQVNLLTGIIAIAAGNYHSLALKYDGTVWGWGYNIDGELGNGTGVNTNVPIQIPSLSGIIAISGGAYHSLVLKNDGTVWAFGQNIHGELGNGITNPSYVLPVQVNFLTGIISIACGYAHSLALKNDGTAWAWGNNPNGELGIGNNTNSNVPIQISSLSGVRAVSGGCYHSVVLKNDGTVWTFGSNLGGQLGNGNNTDSNIPVQVNLLSGIISISSSFSDHSIALKNDGTLWAWGINGFGELGNGSFSDSNIPIQVPGLCQVADAVSENISPMTLAISPNPSNGIFHLNNAITNGEISICNLMGEIIYKSQIRMANTEIDLSEFESGIYFITIKTKEELVTQKIIINH